MINTDLYIHKLEVLKEYMDYYVQIKVFNSEYGNPKAVIRVYLETGYLMSGTPNRLKPFEEYYNHKIKTA
jgi:hypothetical protein